MTSIPLDSDAKAKPNRHSNTETRRWPWPQAAVALALIALGTSVFWRGMIDLGWLAWHDPESSHLLLVPPLLIYLISQRWAELRAAGDSAGWLGVLALAGAVLIWEYGYRTDLRVAGHLAAILLLIGALVVAFGHRVAWAGFGALGLLLFLMPIPYGVRIQFAVPAQRITAAVAEQVLLVGGVDVIREGSVLEVAGIQVGVAEACNGMRMLFAVVLICYAYTITTPMRWCARIGLLALSPLVALVCNVVRVVSTAWVYGWAEQGTADLFHDLSGWAIAGLAFAIIWSAAASLEWLGIPVFLAPFFRETPTTKKTALVLPRGPIACGILVLTVGLGINQTHLSPLDAGDYHERVRQAASELPFTLGSYVGTNVELPPAASELLAPNVLLAREYRNPADGERFTFLFVHCYDARDMMGHYPPVCYPSQGWKLVGESLLHDTPVGSVAQFQFDRGVGSQQEHITVVQGLFIPGMAPSADMTMVNRASGNFRTRHLGAGQWQLVFSGPTNEVKIMKVIEFSSFIVKKIAKTIRL